MNLLNEDNIVHIMLNKIGDVIIANILFVVCSLPIITAGPALSALYHCSLRFIKGNNPGTAKTFFKTFRENFIQSFIIWAGLLAAAIILALNIRFLNYMSGPFSKYFLYLSYALAVFLLIIALYIFAVIAAFKSSIKNHIKNSFLFAFMHFPSTLLIALISLLPMYMTYQDLKLMPLYAFCWCSFGFGLTAYLNSTMFYRMFKPYLEKDEEDISDENYKN